MIRTRLNQVGFFLIFGFFFAWFLLLDLYPAAIALALACFAGLRDKPRGRDWVKFWAVAILIGIPNFFFQMDRWGQRVRRQGIASFSKLDLAGLYTLHGVMTLVGVIPFPEVGREAYHLQFGDGSNQNWQSDFATRSLAVRALVTQQQRTLAPQPIGARRSGRPLWQGAPRNYDEVRVFLAIGCQHMSVSTTKVAGGFEHEAYCLVSYPPNAMSLPFGLSFDERLYRMLEQRGWMHPFEVRWQWHTPPR